MTAEKRRWPELIRHVRLEVQHLTLAAADTGKRCQHIWATALPPTRENAFNSTAMTVISGCLRPTSTASVSANAAVPLLPSGRKTQNRAEQSRSYIGQAEVMSM